MRSPNMRAEVPPPTSVPHRHTPLREVMVRDVISIQLHDRSSVADLLMKHHPIHHLPVLEGQVLRGLIAQRDLYRSMLSVLYYEDERELHSFLDQFTDIASIMTVEPLTLGPDNTLGEALGLMLERRIGCVPVVDELNHLLGIVTDSDLLRVLDRILPP